VTFFTLSSLVRRSSAAIGTLLMISVVGAQTLDASAPLVPELSLQAQAVAQVQQDTVSLTLAIEHSAANQASVNKKLTEALNAAMPVAKSVDTVKARSGAYRVWAVSNREGKVTGWRGRAEILLESMQFAQAAELADKLADIMPLSHIQFSLSDQAKARQERVLLVEAARAFRERAQAVVHAFGYTDYQIRKLDLGGEGAIYVQDPAVKHYGRMVSESLSLVDVPLEADSVSVVVQVKGIVSLH